MTKTKTKPNSRHAQPTLDVLAPRMDKKLNKIAKHMLTLANHTNRLTDEKIILHGQVETLTKAYNRAEVRWKAKYDALLAENASLRETQCRCPPTAANAFVAEPLSGSWEKPNEPMASVAKTDITAPAPSTTPIHVYIEGGRCKRCKQLKAAIEASDLPCVAAGVAA